MEVIILDTPQQVAIKGADIVSSLLADNASTVLGLATGSTPIAMYKELIRRFEAGELSMRQVVSFNLDEYLGLDREHPQSYRQFMHRELFNHIDIVAENTHFPECAGGADPRAVGPAYEQLILDHGGIDLQVLGIGRNGHIGFNEPTSSLGSRTRLKTLDRRTIDDNARMFEAGESQPHMAITMGIATILDARRIMLIATGEHKAEAVRAMVEGPVAALNPASVLQHHQRVRVVLDKAAASNLERVEYYRWVYAQNESILAEHGGAADRDPWLA